MGHRDHFVNRSVRRSLNYGYFGFADPLFQTPKENYKKVSLHSVVHTLKYLFYKVIFSEAHRFENSNENLFEPTKRKETISVVVQLDISYFK